MNQPPEMPTWVRYRPELRHAWRENSVWRSEAASATPEERNWLKAVAWRIFSDDQAMRLYGCITRVKAPKY